MDKISIIVPVYNAEQYISTTIKSILAQTYSDWELILVDDYSKDGSLAICQKFSKDDSRIKVIAATNNQGSAETRNIGLDAATGGYITFVDSDDYVEKDYLKKLHATAKEFNADIVWCNYNEVSGQSNIVRLHGVPTLTPLDTQTIISYFFKGVAGITSPCNKLYSHQIIQDYRIRFDRRMAIGEDSYFNLQVFDKAQRTVAIDDCLYNYVRQNSSSVMATYKPDYYQLYKIRHSFLLYLAEKYEVNYDYQKSAQVLFKNTINFIWQLSKQEKESPILKMEKVLQDGLFQANFHQLKGFTLPFPYNVIYILLKLHLYKMVYYILRKR